MKRHARLTTLGALLLTVTATVAWRHYRPEASGKVATLSIALASRDGSSVVDRDLATKHRSVDRLRAETAATASAECGGCSARAVSLQIVYASSARHTTAENVATAWSSCTDCTSGALSLQVILADRAGAVTADNRAVAANVGCTSCTTTAIAYQIVVVGGHALSARARRQIDAICAQLETSLDRPQQGNPNPQRGNPPKGNQPRVAVTAPAVGQLARLVTADTGASTAVIHSDVKQGSS